MKYHVTSAEAAKLLKKLLDEKSILLADEYRSSTFNAALGEDVESVRPVYDYAVTQQALEHCNRKIRLLKHAINCFNTTQLVGDTGMTIDQVLVYIPQLTEMRSRLYTLQDRLPKQAKEDYTRVSDELRSLQTALDLVNTTVQMEFELPD